MNEIVKIDEGATYEYLRHGFVVFIFGLILLAAHWILALPVIITAIALMAVHTGIEIDLQEGKIRKYNTVLGIKNGKWIDLSDFLRADLKFNSQVSKYDTRPHMILMPGLGKEKVGTARTYDLIFTDKSGKQLLFNPFLKISLAIKAFKALEKIEDLETKNHIDNWISKGFSKNRK